jgi:hypothetical protein
MEMKVTERMTAIREEAIATLGLAADTKIGTGEFIVETAAGFARVTVTAIKDFDFDAVGAHTAYLADVADKTAKAIAKADAKAAVDAEKAAAKAAKAAAKE